MITGLTYTYNAIAQDYCLEECIRSMQPICKEVIVVDCGSTDGTQALIDSLGARRIDHPFDLMKKGPRWIWSCLNTARMEARTPFILQLDADEVLHEADYDVAVEHVWTGRPCWCWRHNFWKNPQTELIEGKVVGTRVVRLAPQYYWLPSDEPHRPEPPIREDAINPHREARLRIFHYGFIRRIDALVAKAKVMTEGYNGSPDPRLDELRTRGVDGFDQFVSPGDTRVFDGTHPAVMRGWLTDRGYAV